MIRAAVLAVLLVPAAVIGLDTPLVMAANHPTDGAFVTTWRVIDTDKPIKIPVGGQTGNYTVDWGDGTNSTTHVSDATHEYGTADDYTVRISGEFTRIHLDRDVDNAPQLLSIDNWGDIEWSSMEGAFSGASNMTYSAVDVPNFSGVTSMSNMFAGASAFNGDLSGWDVSSVTSMFSMFNHASAFDRPLNGWNVSSVTDMSGMFVSASAFDQPLNNWNVSKVTSMRSMFYDAASFNQPLNNWNVSSVTGMSNMFFGASSFNQPLNNWNVSSVTGMSNMFFGASVFVQNLGNWYVVPNNTSITPMAVPGIVGEISAQNDVLRDHTPKYEKGNSDDSDHFEIVSENRINMTSVDTDQTSYMLNVTASGDGVFETENNWRMLVVRATVTDGDEDIIIVNAGSDRIVREGNLVTLSGSVTYSGSDTLAYVWEVISGLDVTLTGNDTLRPQFTPRVTSDEDIEFMLTATGSSNVSAEDTVTITVRDVPISVSSATYNPGSGQLVITFNQNIDSPDYSAMHIRSAGSDFGGIALSGATASHAGRTITATLSSGQQEEYGDLNNPQLVIADGAVTDVDGIPITQQPNVSIGDASQKRSSSSSSSKAPLVNMIALVQARIVDIPPHIAEQVALRDDSDPLEPVIPDGTFDFPLTINGYGYLLDDVTNTLVPQIVTVGDDGSTVITFTVYTQKDLAHFTLYLNLSDENTDYANSDTYITYKDDGTTVVTDPHGYIGDDTAITVTQEDDQIPEKKTVRITIEFGEEPMGPTNMVAYMWNTDRKAVFIKVINAFEVTAALPESVIQTADPEPAVPGSELPADPEPIPADDQMPANPEPIPSDVLWPADDYDEAQVLTLIRMWSGFESEMITDTQLLELLGLEDYRGVDLPDWMMTQLGVLVAKGDVTVDEFMLALQYVLTHA